MEKIFNNISVVGGTIGGFLLYLLGGWDKLIIALLLLMIFDYVTGLIKALNNKNLSSQIGFKGIGKKVETLVIVAVSVVAENMMGIPAMREIVIMFFAVNEALSILENAAELGLRLPPKLKEALIQIRDKDLNKEEKKK